LLKELLAKAGDKIVLPVDNVAATEFSNDAPHEVVGDDIPDNEMGLDIGPKTVEKFRDILKDAKTVVWNGPMGAFEMPNYAEGTLEVGRALADLKDAVLLSVVVTQLLLLSNWELLLRSATFLLVVVLHLTTLKVKNYQESLVFLTSKIRRNF
jgi:hypothetical protein